jgi:hypothetical protein
MNATDSLHPATPRLSVRLNDTRLYRVRTGSKLTGQVLYVTLTYNPHKTNSFWQKHDINSGPNVPEAVSRILFR